MVCFICKRNRNVPSRVVGAVAVMLRVYRQQYTVLSTELARMQAEEKKAAAIRAAEVSILSAQLERLLR